MIVVVVNYIYHVVVRILSLSVHRSLQMNKKEVQSIMERYNQLSRHQIFIGHLSDLPTSSSGPDNSHVVLLVDRLS